MQVAIWRVWDFELKAQNKSREKTEAKQLKKYEY